MSAPEFATADLIDDFEDELQSCETQFRQYGARASFAGPIVTVRCFLDNALVKSVLGTAGAGRVLVVDGGGSLASALLGDLIGGSAVEQGWAGVVINGAVRDVSTLRTLDLGIKALGSNPRKSAKAGAGEVGVPVRFGGVEFRPDAWLYSDADGIVVAERSLR
jgi:regulator of ribonuclease activity A